MKILITGSWTQNRPISEEQIVFPSLQIFLLHVDQRRQLHIRVVTVNDNFHWKFRIIERSRQVWFLPGVVNVNSLSLIRIWLREQPKLHVLVRAFSIQNPSTRSDENAVTIAVCSIRFLTTDIQHKRGYNAKWVDSGYGNSLEKIARRSLWSNLYNVICFKSNVKCLEGC